MKLTPQILMGRVKDGYYSNRDEMKMSFTTLKEWLDKDKHLSRVVFRQDLQEAFGVPPGDAADLLWSHAWEGGHSSGLEEIIHQYADLVLIVRAALEEARFFGPLGTLP